MRKTAIIMLLLSGAAFSDDCVVVIGRNDEIVKVSMTNISMREEEIVITLRKEYYEVDVTIDFFNSGSEEKVQLGFPINVYGRGILFKNFNDYNFKSYINGKIIPVHTTKRDTIFAERGGNGTLWFIRNVTFPANSHTISRVTYKAQYSGCNMLYAGYIYGTGRFWKDGIGKMTVVINHGDDVLIKDIGFGGSGDSYSETQEFFHGSFFGNIKAKSSKFIWESDGRYKYVFENVNPTSGNEVINIYVRTFDSGLYGEYDDPFGIHPEETWGYRIDADGTAFWIWSEYLLYKEPTDIRHYTKNQIRLFINFFSAIHGYDFKNPLYKKYFSKIENFYIYPDPNKEIKYKVNPNFNESVFNEIERKNVNYLLKLEKMIPNKTGEEARK
jgi:hypothetical protein